MHTSPSFCCVTPLTAQRDDEVGRAIDGSYLRGTFGRATVLQIHNGWHSRRFRLVPPTLISLRALLLPAKMGNKTLVSVPGHLLTDNSLTNYVLAALVVITAYLLGSHLNSPLRQYPGPALASKSRSLQPPPSSDPRLTCRRSRMYQPLATLPHQSRQLPARPRPASQEIRAGSAHRAQHT